MNDSVAYRAGMHRQLVFIGLVGALLMGAVAGRLVPPGKEQIREALHARCDGPRSEVDNARSSDAKRCDARTIDRLIASVYGDAYVDPGARIPAASQPLARPLGDGNP